MASNNCKSRPGTGSSVAGQNIMMMNNSLPIKYCSKNCNLFGYEEKTWNMLLQNNLLRLLPEGCTRIRSQPRPRSHKSKDKVEDLTQDFQDQVERETESPGDLDHIHSSNGLPSNKIDNNGLSCSVCRMKFENVTNQREHFKMDWHRYNLKRQLLGKPAVTESEFLTLTTDKIKDISLTDSESEASDEYSSEESPEDQDDNENCLLTKHKEHKKAIPRVYFVIDHSKVHSIYRFLLMSRKSDKVDGSEELKNKFTELFHDKCWIILMLSAGHFAAAVFHRKEVIEHKAIHRYTVRAKRGTSQGIRDSKQHGHSPRSAGASIRRYNETALSQDIQDLLSKWKEHVGHCDKIFIKWPVHYKNILFGGKNPMLDRRDERIRKLSMMTKRPTFNEIKRIHTQLSTIRFHETLQDDESTSREI